MEFFFYAMGNGNWERDEGLRSRQIARWDQGESVSCPKSGSRRGPDQLHRTVRNRVRMCQITSKHSLEHLQRGSQAEIRRYLVPDGCKIRLGEAHVSSREPRMFFEFKVELDEF
jgi:hypothetical protein